VDPREASMTIKIGIIIIIIISTLAVWAPPHQCH
jgi:type II secretory pathway component PulM